MFSGIIQAIVAVRAIYEETNFKTYEIALPQKILSNVQIGSSISNNGCCLTVVAIKHNIVSFNLINETLKLTNMNSLKVGDLINIEKSISYHCDIGGHLMTGHIDCTGEIKKVFNLKKNNKIIWIKIKNSFFQKYFIQKGSVGIEGVSFSINKIIGDHIRICITPYTANQTTFGIKQVGNIVNIETDFMIKSIVDNVEKILSNTYLKKLNNIT